MDVKDDPTAMSCVESLLERYPALRRGESCQAVMRAREALTLFGLLEDPDAATLWVACADREVRLRLGLEVEVARLDPQSHSARSSLVRED